MALRMVGPRVARAAFPVRLPMLAAVVPAAASAQQWTRLATPGGWIKRLAVAPTCPSVAYAGAFRGGLYRSTDSGGSCARTAVAEIGRDTVAALAVDPTSKAVAYAGTETKGIFKSSDGGAHWARFGNGLDGLSVASMILDPTNNNRLYAGTQGAGLFRYGPAATRMFAVRSRLHHAR
jgi:hypothetical protein